MTILETLLAHDAWTTRQLLLRCRELSDEQLDRVFDIGGRSLRDTFVHLVECMELHMDSLQDRPERLLADTYDIAGWLTRHSLVAQDLASFASRVEREGIEDDLFGGDRKHTLGGGIAHLITHGMHHRAQAMYILEQLGVKDVLEGDVLGWEAQARGWGWEAGSSYGKMVAG